jgi:hypothetical protein
MRSVSLFLSIFKPFHPSALVFPPLPAQTPFKTRLTTFKSDDSFFFDPLVEKPPQGLKGRFRRSCPGQDGAVYRYLILPHPDRTA